MNDALFEIGADGVDTAAIVNQVKETVARRRAEGQYSDSLVACAERSNLEALQDDEAFLEFYLHPKRVLGTIRTALGPKRLKRTLTKMKRI